MVYLPTQVVRIWLWSSAAWPSTFLRFFSFSTLYSSSQWRTDKIGTRGWGGGEGIIEGIKETPAIRNPILLNRTVWVGRGGDEVGGDGEFSPSSLLNLATAWIRAIVSPKLSQSSIRFCTVPGSSHVKSKWPSKVTTSVFRGARTRIPSVNHRVTLNSLRRPLNRLLLLP